MSLGCLETEPDPPPIALDRRATHRRDPGKRGRVREDKALRAVAGAISRCRVATRGSKAARPAHGTGAPPTPLLALTVLTDGTTTRDSTLARATDATSRVAHPAANEASFGGRLAFVLRGRVRAAKRRAVAPQQTFLRAPPRDLHGQRVALRSLAFRFGRARPHARRLQPAAGCDPSSKAWLRTRISARLSRSTRCPGRVCREPSVVRP